MAHINQYVRGLIDVLHRSTGEWLKQESIWDEVCSRAPANVDPQLTLLQVGAKRLGDAIRGRVGGRYSLRTNFWWAVTRYLCHADFDSPEAREAIVKALDQIDVIATNSAKEINLVRETCDKEHQDVVLVGGCDYSPNHWIVTQGEAGLGRGFIPENSAVGLAAQMGILSYVKAKLSYNPELLNPGASRISLLENAALGFEYQSLCKAVSRHAMNPPFGVERVETVKYPLMQGADPRIADKGEENTVQSEVQRVLERMMERLLDHPGGGEEKKKKTKCLREVSQLFSGSHQSQFTSSEAVELLKPQTRRMIMTIGQRKDERDE
ncbi:hypothetical protein K458DRAFT_387766 [Lentithecium fluviatile CBS 122367]|uniref:Uncharacterized protein n=1 Tax=Lentithecium fluviatile CBS 122367 TaxID=1168545 RepID=A0A6G1J6H2_9PLEO|nr:hypothetical protein K458DRAFT_387766 [Lentithecium fluviatile CBS 122367]